MTFPFCMYLFLTVYAISVLLCLITLSLGSKDSQGQGPVASYYPTCMLRSGFLWSNCLEERPRGTRRNTIQWLLKATVIPWITGGSQFSQLAFREEQIEALRSNHLSNPEEGRLKTKSFWGKGYYCKYQSVAQIENEASYVKNKNKSFSSTYI